VSKVDENGLAVRNGIDGSDKMLLDLRMQYVHTIRGSQTLGLFWEISNATNRVEFDNPIAIAAATTSSGRSLPTIRCRCRSASA
jgi:hypothetical protein